MTKLTIEASISDIKLHNSRIDDNSWIDIVVRVAGEANTEAAMKLHRAKDKLVRMSFEIEE